MVIKKSFTIFIYSEHTDVPEKKLFRPRTATARGDLYYFYTQALGLRLLEE